MKLPSLNYIIEKSSFTLKRFPLAIVSATLAALTSIYLTEFTYEESRDIGYLLKLVMLGVLGIPLFTVITLISEKRAWNRITELAANVLGIAALGIYYFFLPDDFDNAPALNVFRYFLYIIFVHLLVAIGPYWSKGEMHGFWQYNKTLFLRFLTAVLFSGVLFIGLTVALGSIDVLLGVDIDEKRYLQLYFLIAGIFNTWFFLAGIPKSLDTLEHIDLYPKGLKIFTQNILIPLVIVYLIILYLYMGKIIIEWSWPEGWVAYLVLSFSIVGILALLLLHPIQEKVENRWIKRFSRSYFWVLVPLVILLLLAIWVRIEEYGLTINRYFVLVLGLWLAGIVAYFIISKTKNIKVIPGSLCVIAFLISFGPWGAFSVSENSQIHRLEGYLQENEILIEGSIQKVSEPVPFEDRKEISSITRYLHNNHGLDSIQPWFEQDLSALTKSAANFDSTKTVSHYEIPQEVASLMGIDYVNERESPEQNTRYRSFSSAQQLVLPLEEYEWLVDYQYYQNGAEERNITLGNKYLNIHALREQATIKLSVSENGQDTLLMDLKPLIESLVKNFNSSNSYNIPTEELSVAASNSVMSAKLYFSNFDVNLQDSVYVVTNLNGRLLLRFE